MNTKFIPFDLETMDQALSFKTTDDRVVTQVTYLSGVTKSSHTILGVSCESVVSFTTKGCESMSGFGRDLLMEVEVKIKFPCLCYVCDSNPTPNHSNHSDLVLLLDEDTLTYTGGVAYIDSAGMRWKYATPLTKDEVSDWLEN